MLPLELRQEFKTKNMAATAIELRNSQRKGWSQRPAEEREQHEGRDAEGAHEPDLERRAGHVVEVPGDRDRLHLLADGRDELPEPEEPEVAVTQDTQGVTFGGAWRCAGGLGQWIPLCPACRSFPRDARIIALTLTHASPVGD